MSESGDYDPGPWSGHSFTDARKTYDVHVGRSYKDAVDTKKTIADLLPTTLETKSSTPLVIVTDETGSMGEWPVTIFSKLPYLEHEAKDYLGADTEISFSAIGDARNHEDYPLQCRPFTKGASLSDRLKELVIERKGGGSLHETYELAALYYARNVKMPLAEKGIMIFIGDEKPYDAITPDLARKYAHVDLSKSVQTKDVFKELSKKFSVYAILKPYDGDANNMSVTDKEVHSTWCNLLGEDHVAILPSAERVVDVIFGILAEEKGRFKDYMKEIEDRQKDDPRKVEIAYKSLSTIHNFDYPDYGASKVTGGSRLHMPVKDGTEGDDLA